MTLAEFKAWFEGFTETLKAAPNEKQWERIKARVAEIDGTVTTYPVFVDRYIPPYRRWYDGVWIIQEFGTVESSGHAQVGVLQSFEASISIPNPVGIFGDRDVMADYRLDG